MFEDAKSLIEAEVYRPESVGPIVHIEAPEPPASHPEGTFVFSVADALFRAGAPRVVSAEEIREMEELKRRFMSAQATGQMTVLPSHPEMLESFDAWRCTVCGSRSVSNQRCNVRVSCRNRWREPVRVEIRSRDVS